MNLASNCGYPLSIAVSKMGMTELSLSSLEWKSVASITSMLYSLSRCCQRSSMLQPIRLSFNKTLLHLIVPRTPSSVCLHWDAICTQDNDHAGDEKFCSCWPSHLEQFTRRCANCNSCPLTFPRHLKAHLFSWSAACLRTIYDALYKSRHCHHHHQLSVISPALDVTERIFAVLYVSVMGLTRCYKTTVFLHLFAIK